MNALARFIAHTVYSFGLVLVAVMSSLAAGAAFVALTERRLATRPLLRAALVVEAGLLLLLPWAVVGLRGAVRAGELPTERGLLVSEDDRIRNDVIMDLMCNLVIHKPAMSLHTTLRCSKIMVDGWSVNPSPSPMV